MKIIHLIIGTATVAVTLMGEGSMGAAPAGPGEVKFTLHRLGQFRSEALGVADFNGDGKLDVMAGAYLYLAPGWQPQKVRTLEGSVDEAGKGYYDDFMNLPMDVDGDGKMDVVSCGWFCKCIRWYRNLLPDSAEWPETVADVNGNFEHGDLADIDGDGQAREILAHVSATVWYELGMRPDGTRGLVKHVISEKSMNFGGGVGDLNGDGRPDVLRPDGWYEAPADPRKGQWQEHPWAMGAPEGKADHTPQMLVWDVNRDGLADVITSSAHGHGIFWYEQKRDGAKASWSQHVIDASWSQAHSLALGDINGDGRPDLVVGKRFMAHNGGDPDAFGKLGVYWYELPKGDHPTWKQHVISLDQGIGSGVNLCCVDLDGDGDLDVVVTGKWGGPAWLENRRL